MTVVPGIRMSWQSDPKPIIELKDDLESCLAKCAVCTEDPYRKEMFISNCRKYTQENLQYWGVRWDPTIRF